MSAASEWFAVDVLVDAEAAEAAESAFNSIECLGVETDIWKKSVSGTIRVSGFFESFPDLTLIESAFTQALEIYGFRTNAVQRISHRIIEQADWLAEWKKHWKPVEVGRFIIAPPWADVADSEKHLIRIEPNMAFGTGTHETTQLCLQAISDHVVTGRSFLDVGTGTGILAIAAAKLGASPVLACDVDPDSIKIALENIRANDVSHNVDIVHGSIVDSTPASEFVCANLTLDVILSLLPVLIAKSHRHLLLSGVLTQQKDELADHLLRSGISNFTFETAGEWVAVMITK